MSHSSISLVRRRCERNKMPDLPKIKNKLKKVLIEDGIVSSIYHYYIYDRPDKAYYRVWYDIDTESINFIDPENPENNITIMRCLSILPYGAKTIGKAILIDMELRGFEVPEEIEEIEL